MHSSFNSASYHSVLQEKRHDQNTKDMNLVNTEQFGKLIWNSYMFKCYCAKKKPSNETHIVVQGLLSLPLPDSLSTSSTNWYHLLVSAQRTNDWHQNMIFPPQNIDAKIVEYKKKNHSIVECLLVLCLLPFVSYDSLNANHKDDSLPLCLLWLILQLIPSPHQLMEFSHEKKLPNQFSSRDVGKKRNGTTSKS